MIPKEEYLLWKTSLVTRELEDLLQKKLDELKEYVIYGGTLGDNSIQFTARAVGRAETIQDVLNWYPVEEDDSEV